MTVGEYRDLIGRESSAQYQQELLQLKDDFDRYKTRAQNVLRSKENKVVSNLLSPCKVSNLLLYVSNLCMKISNLTCNLSTLCQ